MNGFNKGLTMNPVSALLKGSGVVLDDDGSEDLFSLTFPSKPNTIINIVLVQSASNKQPLTPIVWRGPKHKVCLRLYEYIVLIIYKYIFTKSKGCLF